MDAHVTASVHDNYLEHDNGKTSLAFSTQTDYHHYCLVTVIVVPWSAAMLVSKHLAEILQKETVTCGSINSCPHREDYLD